MSILRLERRVSTKRSSNAGSSSGSSPCILMMKSNCLAFRATSAMRSVPLWCFGDVIATSAPQSKAALAIRMSSVATMTASNFVARLQRSQTWRRSGLFAIRCNGFPGKRVELHRAGIIPTALLICCLNNDLGRCRQIFGDPVGAAAVGHFVEAGPDTDSSNASIMRALGVYLLVADQKRTPKIDIVVVRCFQNHSRRRLAAFRRLPRRVGTKISRVDQVVFDLARNFSFHGAILFFREKAASNSALIGNHDNFISSAFEATQCRGSSFENLNLFRIGAVIGVVHDGAVTINEDGARLRSSRSHFRNSRSIRRA